MNRVWKEKRGKKGAGTFRRKFFFTAREYVIIIMLVVTEMFIIVFCGRRFIRAI